MSPHIPETTLAQIRRALYTAWRFAAQVVRTLLDASGLEHAAAIAFFALLSLLPFALLTVGLMARALSGLDFGDHSGAALDSVLDPLSQAVPTIQGGLRELVVSLAARPMSLDLITVATLVVAASAGFNAVSAGVNAVLQTEHRRTYLLTRLLVAGLALGSAAAILVWTIGLHLMEAWAAHFHLGVPAWIADLRLTQLLIKLLLLTVGFYLLVKFTATERYPRGYRWLGAALFSVCFHAAQWGFAIYLTRLTSYDRFYGTAGAFFGLSLWLYIAAILLLGACAVIRTAATFEPPPPTL